ncbi:MFS transporter [Quadrisphaera sp. KR29]|uniref:MFS transporter n=1 Tax=Quadrisphaera sp. KR29 TaxID=3461391 RepID=UPI004043D70B
MSAVAAPVAGGRPPWKVAVLGGAASYIDAATIIAAGTAFVLYRDALGLGAWDIGVLSAVLTLGLAVGALVGGRLGDRFGRKRVFSVDLLVLVAGLLVLALAPSTALLYAGTAVTGLALGADIPVSLALIAEESPPEHRSRLVAFSQVMWIGGIVGSQAVGFAVSGLGELGGRILFAQVAVITLVVWALRRTLPESTAWSRVRTAADVPPPGAPGTRRPRLGVLAAYTAPLTAVTLFYVLNNLSANTMGQLGTFLFVDVAGVSPTLATGTGLVGTAVGLTANLLFMRIAGRPSRMTGFVVGTLLLAAGFSVPVVLGVSYPTVLVAALLSAFGGGLAGEAIFKVWSQELFPTAVRATAQGTAIFVTRALTAAFAVVTPALAEASPRGLFAVLVAVNLGAGLVGLLWVARRPRVVEPEDTRGPEAVAR